MVTRCRNNNRVVWETEGIVGRRKSEKQQDKGHPAVCLAAENSSEWPTTAAVSNVLRRLLSSLTHPLKSYCSFIPAGSPHTEYPSQLIPVHLFLSIRRAMKTLFWTLISMFYCSGYIYVYNTMVSTKENINPYSTACKLWPFPLYFSLLLNLNRKHLLL